MGSRIRWVVLALLSAACRVENANPPAGEPRPQGQGFSFELRRDTAALPSEHEVFDRKREELAPGVVRLTVGAIVRTDRGRAAARAALERIVDEERRRDSTVAAIRVLGYLSPAPGAPGPTQLQPLGYLDWVPLPGWDSLTALSRGAFHRINIVWLVEVPDVVPRTP